MGDDPPNTPNKGQTKIERGEEERKLDEERRAKFKAISGDDFSSAEISWRYQEDKKKTAMFRKVCVWRERESERASKEGRGGGGGERERERETL